MKGNLFMKKRQKSASEYCKSTGCYQFVTPQKTADMQECKICHRMDDRNYRLHCGHQFCLFCLEIKLAMKNPCCNTCLHPISMGDNIAIWRQTHCTQCDNWISGSYGRLCENCWFESDEFAEKVMRSAARNDDSDE